MIFLLVVALSLLQVATSVNPLIAPLGLCSTIVIKDVDTDPCLVTPVVWMNCSKEINTNKVYCASQKRNRQVPGSTNTKITCLPKAGTGDCSTCEGDVNQTEAICDGTTEYCGLYTCDPGSPCTCNVAHYDVISEMRPLGRWEGYEPIAVGFAWDTVDSVSPPDNHVPWGYDMTYALKRRSVKSNRDADWNNIPNQSILRSTTFVTLEGANLIVTTPNPGATRVVTSKDGVQDILYCAATRCLNELRQEYFLNPGSLRVQVFLSDILDSDNVLAVEPFIMCAVPRCVLCYQMYSNFSCFPWQFQVFVVASIIALFFGIIVMLIAFIRGMCFFSCCRKCGKKTYSGTSDGFMYIREKLKKWKNRSKSPQPLVSPNSSQDIEIEMDTPTVSLVPANRYTTNAQTVYLILAIFGLFLSVVSGEASCAQGININVPNSVCTVSGTVETCNVEFDSVFSIPGVGQAACYNFMRTDGTPILTARIEYTQMYMVAPLQSLYYTAGWAGMATSWKACFNTNHCGLWNCGNYNPLNDPWVCTTNIDNNQEDYSRYGQGWNCFFEDPLWRMWPGNSRCDSQCGCAGCGCFWCNSACVYSRYIVVPNTSPCQVLTPITVYLRPQIRINTTFSDGQSVQADIDIISNSNDIGGNVSLTIDGSLSGSIVQFANQKVVACANDVSLGAASDVNAPVAHAVGDIQANTPSSFSPWNNFLIATGIETPIPTSDSTTYVFEASGWGARSSHDFLPTTRGSVMWSYSANSLVGIDTAPGALIGHLASSTPVVVQRVVNVVCPVITSANVSGCYSCDQGATITIFAHSSCSAGFASVTMTGGVTVATTNVNLGTTDQRFDIRFNAATASISGILTLVSGQYSDHINFVGTLVPESLVVEGNQTVILTGGNNTGSGLPDFANWFNSLGSLFKGLLIAGMVVGAIILAIVVFVIISKSLNAYRSWSIQQKYERLDMQQKQQALDNLQKRNLDYQDMDFK